MHRNVEALDICIHYSSIVRATLVIGTFAATQSAYAISNYNIAFSDIGAKSRFLEYIKGVLIFKGFCFMFIYGFCTNKL
jgi:hypothetical protein